MLPQAWTGNDIGRATKGAALTLLGKAYLQSAATVPSLAGNYAKADAAFRQARALGYSLDPNYASLFDATNEKSPEIIWSIQNVRIGDAPRSWAAFGLGPLWSVGLGPVAEPAVLAA